MKKKHAAGRPRRCRGWAALLLCAAVWGLSLLSGPEAYASGAPSGVYDEQAPLDDPGSSEEIAGILQGLNLEEADRYLAGQPAGTVSLTEMVRKLISGDFSGAGRDMLSALYHAFLKEAADGSRLIGRILLLGILGAVFSNFSGVFDSSQISETGFFVIYLLLFALLTAAVSTGMEVAADCVASILGFMRVLMPSYFLAVAFSGGTVSSVAMYEMTMLGMTAGEWVLDAVMIPLVRIYFILTMAGNIVKENVFSRMIGLAEQIINWGMKTLVGVVLGVQVLQTLVLPYVDSLKNGAVQKLISLIPGIGSGAAAAAQMFLGAGVLIKNSVGMAAVVILMLLIAAPAAKLWILMMICQCAAAVMEPVCDKRVLTCVSAAAKVYKILLQIVAAAALLLVITVAVVCAGTNVTYYV